MDWIHSKIKINTRRSDTFLIARDVVGDSPDAISSHTDGPMGIMGTMGSPENML
jgi:hypothetical protein